MVISKKTIFFSRFQGGGGGGGSNMFQGVGSNKFIQSIVTI